MSKVWHDDDDDENNEPLPDSFGLISEKISSQSSKVSKKLENAFGF